jgi:hypothetical protein
MAVLTVTPIQKAGIADVIAGLTAADVAGDSVQSSSGIFIAVNNGDASPHTLTIAAPVATTDCGAYGALAVADITLVVAAGDVGFVSVPLAYTDSGNSFSWTYDAVTAVTVGVFSIAP